MAQNPSSLSIAEYLSTSYTPDMHFVAGRLEARHLGTYDHGKTQGMLACSFLQHAALWRTNPVVSQRIRVRSNKVRVCDVAILRADAPREAVTTTPPLICVEILSPDDRLSRTKLVLADYLAMGVENIWLIDPIYRAAFTYNAAGLHEADLTQLSVPNTPISVDLNEIFAALD